MKSNYSLLYSLECLMCCDGLGVCVENLLSDLLSQAASVMPFPFYWSIMENQLEALEKNSGSCFRCLVGWSIQ